MLVIKNGITHQIDGRRLSEFKEKGYTEANEPEPAPVKPKSKKPEGGK